MSLVIDETLAGVELAPGLTIDQELFRQMCLCVMTETHTTSDPSMTVPPLILDTVPNGSSLGRRFAFSRAMYRSSPIAGSIMISIGRMTGLTMPTRGGVCRHINDRVPTMDDIVVRQSASLTSHLDVVTWDHQHGPNNPRGNSKTHHFESQ